MDHVRGAFESFHAAVGQLDRPISNVVKAAAVKYEKNSGAHEKMQTMAFEGMQTPAHARQARFRAMCYGYGSCSCYPTAPQNGSLNTCPTITSEGQSCQFSCNLGFNLTGTHVNCSNGNLTSIQTCTPLSPCVGSNLASHFSAHAAAGGCPRGLRRFRLDKPAWSHALLALPLRHTQCRHAQIKSGAGLNRFANGSVQNRTHRRGVLLARVLVWSMVTLALVIWLLPLVTRWLPVPTQ